MLDAHNCLGSVPKYQHGFRKGASTETQLIRAVEYMAKALDSSSQVDAIALDFSKAFDVVPHHRLLLKIRYYGLGPLEPWFKDFLVGRKQTVVVEGVHSREIEVLSGVPQGTVLGPLCFLLFINDLPEEIESFADLPTQLSNANQNRIDNPDDSFIGIFADDTLIAREIKTPDDASKLQKDLKYLENWTKIWGMQFNAGKCELLRVTRKRKPIDTDYYLNDTKLKQKKDIKYLGVTIDEKLSWKTHIMNKKKKGTTVLNMIRRNLHFAPKSV